GSPPPPPGFQVDASPPPISFDADFPPPPPGFHVGPPQDLLEDAWSSTRELPAAGLPPPPPPGFQLGAPPPPPPGFVVVPQPVSAGSLGGAAQAANGALGGHADGQPPVEDSTPGAFTPDFFARAGKRRS
ncbi:MAG: hypothetical protein ACRDXC_05390, partial [Acidimicrobiales bacterium]